MIWLILLALVAFLVIWVAGATNGRRAPNRLNNQGLPQGVTHDDHRHNDEE